MKKTIAIILSLLLVLVSCASTEEQKMEVSMDSSRIYSSMSRSAKFRTLFDEFNSFNGTVAMGISGPYTDKELALEKAMENCVQYLALYRGLALQQDMVTSMDSSRKHGDFDYNIFGGTTDEIYSQTMMDLEVVRTVWYGDVIGAVVFARIPEIAKPCRINENWMDNPPADMISATSVKRYSKYPDAIEAAIFQAAVTALDVEGSKASAHVVTDTTESTFHEDSYSVQNNSFKGFRILALDYNPDESKVYALVTLH